jgi:hypothetical protein
MGITRPWSKTLTPRADTGPSKVTKRNGPPVTDVMAGTSRRVTRRIATSLSRGGRRPPLGPPAGGSGTSTPSALDGAAARLVARLAVLEAQLDAEDDRVWPDYLAVAQALAVIWPLLAPGQHRLLTTAELAAQLGISAKTLRRRKSLGLLQPALEHGRLVRWRADQEVR